MLYIYSFCVIIVTQNDALPLTNMPSLLQSHPSITHASDIQHLCEPLRLLDISTFSHLRVLDGNQLTIQCSHPNFFQNYINNQYYTADPCTNVCLETSDIGEYIIWDAVTCSGKTAKMLADSAAFDFKHVFTIIKKADNHTDFYHFGTHLFNPNIYQLYINNLDLLDRFISYFSSQTMASKILSRAYNMVLNSEQVCSGMKLNESRNVLFPNHVPRKKFLELLTDSEEKGLTPKEIECIALIIAGKTAKEISKELCVSFRTIEDRISNIKIKLDVKNKAELIVKLLKIHPKK